MSVETLGPSDGESSFSLRRRGAERLRAGDFAQAVALLDRAAALAPGDAGTRLEFGVALQGARRHEEALEQFARVREVAPNEPMGALHAAFSELALGRPEPALAAARVACDLAPAHAHAHFARGRALLELGETSEAEAAFAKALDASPQWADAWVQRGIARSRLGDVEGAKTAFREALRHAPGHKDATANLAALERARPAATVKPAETPALRDWRPDSPEAALGLAVVHLRRMPAFARLQFGEWSQVLIAQITRGHYFFVVDQDRKIRGFLGWALTREELAEEWVEGRAGLRNEDCVDGDCIIINAWASDARAVTHFTVDLLRKFYHDKRMVYYKRHYRDGRVRPVRLNVNAFVGDHIARTGRD